MDEPSLYHQIAESIRNDILTGRYKPGDRLPSVRKLCEDWNCTPGTIQRAYVGLAREGLLVSRAGRGTQVAGVIPVAKAQTQGSFRRASLVNRTEAFLLEALTTGYNLGEIQQAMDLAMDRWRIMETAPEAQPSQALRFSGSHDMALNAIAHFFFGRVVKDVALQVTYNGSLGGLIAMAEGKADLAGCHLWDAESETYNLPFVRRLLPGKEGILITLAHRRIGLILAPGNPKNIHDLADIVRPGIRFVNRQPGSGTRVWLDVMVSRMGIDPKRIAGYGDERMTHSDIARCVAQGEAEVGLGLETAAQAYDLDFLFLNRERYDLIMLKETANLPVMQKFAAWLASEDGKALVAEQQGYETVETGTVRIFGQSG